MFASKRRFEWFGGLRATRAAKQSRSATGRIARAACEVLEARQFLSVTPTITSDSGTPNVVEGGTVSLSLSAVTKDPSGSVTADLTKWVIDPGDGSGDQDPIYVNAGDTGNFSYNYAGEENTNYHLTAQVYDMGDGCNIPPDTTPYPASFDSTVVDAPITVTGQEIDTSEGVEFEGAVAIVNDTAYTGGDVSNATINWRDGAVTGGTIVSLGGGQYEIDGTHEYNSTGTYQPIVTAYDIGGASGSGLATVNAAKVTLTTDATSNTIIVSKTGDPVTVTVTCSVSGLGLSQNPDTADNYTTTTRHPDASTWTLTFESHSGGTGTTTITLKARAQDGTLLDDSALTLTIKVVP